MASSSVDDIIAIEQMIAEGQSNIGKYERDGEIHHIAFSPIVSKGWTLVVSIKESEMLKGLIP